MKSILPNNSELDKDVQIIKIKIIFHKFLNFYFHLKVGHI